VVERLFQEWRSGQPFDPETVDRFCQQLPAHGAELPVVYFCEWVDRWLMGDQVPGSGAVQGSRFQVTCLSRAGAQLQARQCGNQFEEQKWLASRLREAATSWAGEEPAVVVVVREVLGGSTTDEEIRASLRVIPD
jgi:hypothetical protein